jgi:hypothetical protein
VLTPEQREHLRSTIKAAGVGQQGHTRSAEENAHALLMLAARYGRRKKMVLILDNAKYHHTRGEDWMTPSKMKKTEIGATLRYMRVPSVCDASADPPRVYPAAKFTADHRAGGPPVELLRRVLTDYIKSHPAVNTTRVHQLMTEAGHALLYTPPYESWLQPIELVWAQVKQQVAQQARVGRKWQETAKQTKAAMSAMTPAACGDVVRHTEDAMDVWLRSAAAGSMRRYGSLHELGRLTPQQRHALTDLNVPDTAATGDAGEDGENADPTPV